MNSVLLKACGLSYRLGGRPLVAEADIELLGGEITVVVGPNGAGKSTLLKLLSGELKPHAGEVAIGGKLIAGMEPWRLACHRAVMSQNVEIGFAFTVREVVALGLAGVGRLRTRDAHEEIVEACLGMADVTHLAERNVLTLSGGERQRAQFARAIAQLMAGASLTDGQILLLDEPTASLDLAHQLRLLDGARRMADQRLAVLAIVHDLNLAAAYADTLVVMSQGRIVARGRPAEVLTDRLMREVFDVPLRVGATPPAGEPFVLVNQQRAG